MSIKFSPKCIHNSVSGITFIRYVSGITFIRYVSGITFIRYVSGITFIRYVSVHWVDTSAGGLLVPRGIIYPVAGVSVLTWFIRYLCFYYYHWVDTSAGGLLVIDPVIVIKT
jgi:hypothetical protein